MFGGGLPSLPPADLAFSLLFCPHPPDPLPSGKGEIFCFLMQGAPPLAFPGLNPDGTGYFLPCQCFLPPSPDPLPDGKGEIFGFLMQGAPPLAFPGLKPRGAGLPEGSAPCIPGAEPGRHWLFSAASVLFAPIPRPPSRREGGDFCFLMQGAPPLASP